jgi:hypothetical protein
MEKQQGFHIDQEVDLLEYLRALLLHKFKIVISATIGSIIVFGISLLIENQYSASTLVAININTEPGGVSPSTYRSSDTLGLLEHDFLLDAANAHSNEIDRLLAKMRSIGFNEVFFEEQNLLPILFKEYWNPETNKWNDDFVPDLRYASMAFDEIRFFEFDDETELLKIGFSTTDPQLSAALSNAFVLSFNKYLKEQQSKVIANRREFLNKRLKEVDNIELHRSIFRMIETQLAAESLLHARQDYPLEVIHPALPPVFKNYPKRKQWAALTFILLTLLGIMITIGSVVLSKLKAGLAGYNLQIKQENSEEFSKLEQENDLGLSTADEWVDEKKE